MNAWEQGSGLFIHHCISRALIRIWHTIIFVNFCSHEYLLNKRINTEIMWETFEVIPVRIYERLNW